jgi:hypothetical protein
MHGPMAAIESNMLINGNWDATGKSGVPDLSEAHLDWWNGFNTFHNADEDPSNPDGIFIGTGNFKVVAAYLSRGEGSVWEFGEDSYEVPPERRHAVFDYYYVPDIEWYVLEPDLSNIDFIKRKIMSGGAVGTAISRNEDFVVGYDHYQPPGDPRIINHAIAIVGWDDNRETNAPLPGAWLCKNSEGSGWGEHGYFWVSYYDKYCCRHPEAGVVAFLNADYLPHGCYYNYFYYHDYHGWRDTKNDCSEAFNAFIAPGDHEIRAVSFFTAADSITFTVKIFDSFESGQLTKELAVATGTIEFKGFHTVKLETPLEILAGNDFYIYLQLSDGGQPYDCTSQLAITLGGLPAAEITSYAEPGQSYFFNGSEWQDLYEIDNSANFCIKGMAFELAPLPVEITAVLDGGDGRSLMVVFDPPKSGVIDRTVVFCKDDASRFLDSMVVSASDTVALFEGLTEGREYLFYAIAEDDQGRRSLTFEYAYGIPRSLPAQPQQLAAHTLHNAIEISWSSKNTELDFDYYAIMRDGSVMPETTTDTFFVDDDPALGIDFHDYLVMAVDNDGNFSDTAGIETVSMRAASLQPDRILAINRSGSNRVSMVDPVVTGELMAEALNGLTYDYLSDSSSSNPDRAGLFDMIDYGLIIIGAESGRQDDIGKDSIYGGILDEIGYYLKIGGKAVIFGRWGDIAIDNTTVDTVYYPAGHPGSGYHNYFDIDYRVIPRTYANASDVSLESDFIGAHSQAPGYPDLEWDSMVTSYNSGIFENVTGIPCPAFSEISGSNTRVLYTYNSSSDSLLTEGKPVAWRNDGGPLDYVFFELPLSFMERVDAISALRQAIGDLGIITDVDDHATNSPLPREFALVQNYPNPFNPSTTIQFYNPGPQRAKVTLEVFNILGQQVIVLHDGSADPGWNEIEWDGRDQSGHSVASGVYFYRLKTDRSTLTRKMMLLK